MCGFIKGVSVDVSYLYINDILKYNLPYVQSNFTCNPGLTGILKSLSNQASKCKLSNDHPLVTAKRFILSVPGEMQNRSSCWRKEETVFAILARMSVTGLPSTFDWN